MECTSSKLTVVNSYVLSLVCRPSQIPTEVHISQWMLRLGGVEYSSYWFTVHRQWRLKVLAPEAKLVELCLPLPCVPAHCQSNYWDKALIGLNFTPPSTSIQSTVTDWIEVYGCEGFNSVCLILSFIGSVATVWENSTYIIVTKTLQSLTAIKRARWHLHCSSTGRVCKGGNLKTGRISCVD